MVKIVIVGAGVIGLTTAYKLLKEGHEVSIVAKHLPGDQNIEYTSPKAGAFYIPLTSRNDTDENKYFDLKSYHEVLRFHDTRPECGVLKIKARVLIDKSQPVEEIEDYLKYQGPWWKDVVEGYRILTLEEYRGDNIVFGFEYDTFVITPVHYLHFMLFECIKLGLKYRRLTIAKLTEAIDHFIDENGEFTRGDLIINCSGIGATSLVPEDRNNVAIKGQTVLVENNVPFLTVVEFEDPEHPDETVYVIPRKEGGTLLNGIYSYHNNSTHLDDDLSQRIMQRALIYAPELIDTSFKQNKPYLKIVSHNIGIRPGRFGSPRVEAQRLENGVQCIHNYGNGSSGYIQSFSTAEKVLGILGQLYSSSKL